MGDVSLSLMDSVVGGLDEDEDDDEEVEDEDDVVELDESISPSVWDCGDWSLSATADNLVDWKDWIHDDWDDSWLVKENKEENVVIEVAVVVVVVVAIVDGLRLVQGWTKA